MAYDSCTRKQHSSSTYPHTDTLTNELQQQRNDEMIDWHVHDTPTRDVCATVPDRAPIGGGKTNERMNDGADGATDSQTDRQTNHEANGMIFDI